MMATQEALLRSPPWTPPGSSKAPTVQPGRGSRSPLHSSCPASLLCQAPVWCQRAPASAAVSVCTEAHVNPTRKSQGGHHPACATLNQEASGLFLPAGLGISSCSGLLHVLSPGICIANTRKYQRMSSFPRPKRPSCPLCPPLPRNLCNVTPVSGSRVVFAYEVAGGGAGMMKAGSCSGLE